MAIVFHAASGSPYAWRVWFALEHSKLAYELRMASFAAGDLKKPEYLAINPRGRVPAIVDNGFGLYESAAIVEYIHHAYPDADSPLIPNEPRAAAIVRRLVCEADQYVQPPMERLVDQILFTKESERESKIVDKACAELVAELARWDTSTVCHGGWLAGSAGPTAADYAFYPMLALLRRLETRFGGFKLTDSFGANLQRFMSQIESLPFYERTYPPHWRA